MITGGPVMEYLKYLAGSKNNCLIFVGYQAEGTLGSRIQKGWRDVPFPTENGRQKLLKIEANVTTVEGFSGHSDRNQLINYVSKVHARPERIIIGHGEASKSINLASALHKMYRVETIVPRNLDAVRLR